MGISILYLDEHPDTDQERNEYGTASDNTDQPFRQMIPPQAIDQETDQRQQRDEVNEV